MTRAAGYRLAILLLAGGHAASASPAAAQTLLTLEAAMQRARADTVDARALTSAVAEAGARVQQAQSGFWPRVDLTETVQRGNHPVFVFSSLLSQRRFTAANFAIAALNQPDPLTHTRTAIELEQPLFDGGLTRLGVQAARLGREIAATANVAAGQDLAFRAAEAFLHVVQLEAAVRAAEAAVAAAESDRERVRARREAGLVTEADVLAVDVHLADMRQRQIASGGELDVARIQLAESVGLPLTERPTVVRPPPPSPLAADAGALVREALASHPRRREADLEVQRAANARSTARAFLLPTVGLQGGWDFNGTSLGTQQSSWIVGAELRVNVFRGFADRARLAEAGYAQARASAERERVERRIEVDVRSAFARVNTARAREAAGRAALAQARESQRIIRDRYESGLATVTDVLRAAEAVLEAEARAMAAEVDLLLQTVALDRAVGRL